MKYLYALFALLGSILCYTAQATPIFSSFDPSLLGGTIVTFDDVTSGPYTTLTTNGVLLSDAATPITPHTQGISVQQVSVGNQFLRYSSSVFPAPESSVSAVPQVLLRIDFLSPVSAFGLNVSGSYPYSLKAYDESGFLIETFGPTAGSYNNYFMGIASTTAISYAVLGNIGGFDYLNVDNLTYNPIPNAVPLPATLTLMLSALSLLGFARRLK
jgi:hypothetical protein